MKIGLVVPFYNQQRGNTVTVNRISNGLQARGIATNIINSTGENNFDVSLEVDLVHGFHSYQFSQFKKRSPVSLNPYIITMTGTDINHDLYNENRREEVIDTLWGAEAIHVFEEGARETIEWEIPALKERLFVIPQGVSRFTSVNSPYLKEKDTFLFILPAGIRKIKNIGQAIFVLEKLRQTHPFIRLWLVGPVIEKEEGRKIKQLVDKHSDWIDYLGQVPHAEMGALLSEGDVVLNTSISEGQPSAILEAMNFGIPPIVSENRGNQSIVTDGQTGFVYRNEEEFLHAARTLIENPSLRLKMGRESKKYVKAKHSLEKEISSFISIYRQVVVRI